MLVPYLKGFMLTVLLLLAVYVFFFGSELSAAAAMPLPQIERKIAQALSNGFKDVKAGLEA